MRPPLRSLFAGVAILATPVSLSLAQGGSPPVSQPPVAGPPRAAADTGGRTLIVDAIAANVGDQVVLVSEVMAAVNQRPDRDQLRTEADFIRAQKEALQGLIEAELLVQKAKAEKIEVADSDLQSQLAAHEKRVRGQFQTEAQFRTALRNAGMGTPEEWRRMQESEFRRGMMQRQLYEKYRRDGKITQVNVSEADLREAFDAAKGALGAKPALVSIRQIVLPTLPSEASKARARAKADSIRTELLKRPNDFESIAKSQSMDGSAAQGGDLGWARRGSYVPAFERVVFALNPGVISPVIETGFGYHIIRVDRVQPAEVKSRHILIRPVVDSVDEARAKAVALSVAEAWRKGANVDSLTIAHHDETADEQRVIPDFIRDSLPEAYRNAIEGKKAGEVLEPFPVQDPTGARKWVVAQLSAVSEAGEFTYEEKRAALRAQLSEERAMRRLIDTLKEQTYVAVRYDPAKVARP